MANTGNRGLFALYQHEPDAADRLVFGRQSHRDRRGFLKGAGLAAMSALVGATIPFHRTMPAHFLPIALAGLLWYQGQSCSPELLRM